jgi:ABC-type sugar transport system permease subunit
MADRSATLGEQARTDWIAYLFIAFFTLPFLIFNVGPILFGAGIAFTKWGIFGSPHFMTLGSVSHFAARWPTA